MWGKLGLALLGRAMFSKFLIQFSADQWGCAASLWFGLRWPSPGICSLCGIELHMHVGEGPRAGQKWKKKLDSWPKVKTQKNCPI